MTSLSPIDIINDIIMYFPVVDLKRVAVSDGMGGLLAR